MAYNGINFRATAGFETDGAGQTHCLGEAYPITRAGKTFGFSTSLTANSRDRVSTFPPELAGVVFRSNAAGVVSFRFDLPEGPGNYLMRLAFGDAGSEQEIRATVRDGVGGTVLLNVNGTSGAASDTGGFSWFDATGVKRQGAPETGLPGFATSWPFTNAAASVTLTGPLIIELATSTASASTTLAHVSLEGVAAAPVITGPSGAAGAASSTANVAENASTGPTFNTSVALGSGYPTLTGAQAANWTITALSATSWRVDPVTPFNFESGGLVNPQAVVFNASASVSQSCSITLTNLNEAPTFSGPDISVPGLVVGTPMASINAALRFADPDSGDTGTYSAVGTWPAGITVSSAGLISGTPSAVGTSSSLRVRRTDVGGLTADSNLFSIAVSATSTPVSFSGPVGAQSGAVGSAFSWSGAPLSTFFGGSLTPFSYNVSAGSLPPGLSLNASTGVVTGTPTTAGTFNATFRALDTGSNAATSNSVAFTIGAAPPPPPPPPAGSAVLPAVATDATGSSRRLGQTSRMVVEPFTTIEALGTGVRTIATGTTDPSTGEITLTGLAAGKYAVMQLLPGTGAPAALQGVAWHIVDVT